MIRPRTLTFLLLATPRLALGQGITAESAAVLDAGSGKFLWTRNANEVLYPASTTKIMTALLLVEHCKPDEVIVAPADVQKIKEASMHLRPGERVKAKDMLYALLLRSANDGCYAVAVHLAGSVSKFSEMMNQRAAEIGCTHTHFDNPNGLNDPLHYTTAHDLALMGREAMRYDAFRQTVRTEKTKINRGTNWKDLWMVNHNKVLKRDPTCDGIKTGWTIPAGHCFVGSASRENWRVITVVMKSKSWENDTEALFNWAFGTYKKVELVKAGEHVGSTQVTGGSKPAVDLIARQGAYALAPKAGGAAATWTLDVPAAVEAPLTKSQKLGELVVRDPDGFEQRVPLGSAEDVSALQSSRRWPKSDSSKFWIGGGLALGVVLYRGRIRKKRPRLFRL